MSQHTFFFLKGTVPVYICNEARVILSIESNVHFLFKVVCISEGGKVIRVGYKGRGLGSNEWRCFQCPPIGLSISVFADTKDVMVVVNIVVVKMEVMGVFILTTGEMDLFAVLDMILKAAVIDGVLIRFGSVMLRLVGV
jgi:hypothetical protein